MEEKMKIKRSPRKGRGTRKKKKSQIPYALLVLFVIVLLAFPLAKISTKLVLFWITGTCFGFVLQRARFCFTASMRDPYLTGGTNLTKAVLLAFAITSVAFISIKYGAYIKGLPIPGQGSIAPISLATAIGGVMFGIGMVIAGGCASGTLMRVGEGFYMQVLSLTFFVIGSLWGVHDIAWWKLNFIARGKAIFLPDVFGWFGAVVVQLSIIVLLWIAADKWGKRKIEN